MLEGLGKGKEREFEFSALLKKELTRPALYTGGQTQTLNSSFASKNAL